jgi:hypothetical protein
MSIEIIPTGAALGAEIRGVDLARPIDDEKFAAIAINPKQLDRLRDRFSVAGARTIAATPMCRPMAYARTGVCSAAFRLLIHGLSNCVRGRVLQRNSGRNGFG